MQNARNLHEQRGRSDFDYRHRWVTSYIYEVPFGKGKTYLTEGTASHVLGGWRISGVTNLRSGRPFSIFAGANNSLVGNRGGLANALADCVTDGALPTDERNVDRWFDARGYSVPTPARLGNCGRNTLDGPGLVNFDFALARSFVKYIIPFSTARPSPLHQVALRQIAATGVPPLLAIDRSKHPNTTCPAFSASSQTSTCRI